MEDYWSSSEILSHVYNSYLRKLADSKHLPHQQLISQLYKYTFSKDVIDEPLKYAISLFYMIINSLDDSIDEAPLEKRKEYYSHAVLIFSAQFPFFYYIVRNLDISEQSLGVIDHFFTTIQSLIPQVVEAVAIEKALPIPSTNSPSEIAKTIITIQENRCADHFFICQILNELLQPKIRVFIDISPSLILYKALEFFVKDLSPQELKQDQKNSTFNILLYIQRLGITTNQELLAIIDRIISLFHQRFFKESSKLPQKAQMFLKKKFNEKLEELEKKKLIISSFGLDLLEPT